MKWSKTKFGDFAEIQPSVSLNRGEEYPFVPMEIVEPHRRAVQPAETRLWDGGGGARFQNGDTIFARITPCLEHGKTAQIRGLEQDAGFGSTEFLVFRGRPKISDSDFIFYLACSEVIRQPAIKSMVGASGRQRAQRTVIEELPVTVPTAVEAQREIADVLSAYDELMENNRRRMGLLEDAAGLLYRERFVRLHFPGHERARRTNGLPQGWERKVLGDICDDIREIVSPENLEPDLPYIGLEHIPRRSISLCEWAKVEAVTSSKNRFKTGDILFGKIRPYFHKVGIAFTDGVASSDAIVIRPNTDELRSFVLMTVSSDEFVAEASQTMREGSKMPRADWKLMTQYPVALPPRGLLESFSGTVNAITDQLRNLCFQNQKLRAARDLLLPRLMSGEISI